MPRSQILLDSVSLSTIRSWLTFLGSVGAGTSLYSCCDGCGGGVPVQVEQEHSTVLAHPSLKIPHSPLPQSCAVVSGVQPVIIVNDKIAQNADNITIYKAKTSNVVGPTCLLCFCHFAPP